MARMTVVANSILPCQEAFLVDAPTPAPHHTGGSRLSQLEGMIRNFVVSGVV